MILQNIISDTQHAFIQGRQNLDASVIGNEALDKMKRRREAGLLYKLDTEKAYDYVDWEFL